MTWLTLWLSGLLATLAAIAAGGPVELWTMAGLWALLCGVEGWQVWGRVRR